MSDRQIICEIISEMLDNQKEYGIYPTTRAYDKLEAHYASIRIELEQEFTAKFVEALRATSAYAAGRLAEREECAKVCEELAKDHGWNYHMPSVGRELAAAIRARNET